MEPRKIIIDTDPGIDDAAAIAIALQNPNFDVKLICTTAANVEVEKTTLNALRLVEFIGADVPVARGCNGPLLKKLDPCPEVHGASGMDGFTFPPVKGKPLAKHSVEAMREMIMESEGKITLVPLAALTNIALLLHMYPEVKEKIDEIILMGGGNEGGNTNSTAEFNIFIDPHAAAMVFAAGLPITMVGLDVTRYALVRPATMNKMKESGKVGSMLYDLFHCYRDGAEGLRIHDACVFAYMLKPELFKTEMRHIEVATEGPAAGTTVYDRKRAERAGFAPNANVCVDVDTEKFEEWFAQEFCK